MCMGNSQLHVNAAQAPGKDSTALRRSFFASRANGLSAAGWLEEG